MYIDNVSETSTIYSGDISQAMNYNIGKYGATTTASYTGALDELGIWNRSLAVSEINELWNSGAGFTYPFTLPPGNITIIIDNLNVTNNFTYDSTSNKYYVKNNATIITNLSVVSTNSNVNGTYLLNFTINDTSSSAQYMTNELNKELNLTMPFEGIYEFNSTYFNNETETNSTGFFIVSDITDPTLNLIVNDTEINSFSINFSTIINITDNLSGIKTCNVNVTELESVNINDSFSVDCYAVAAFDTAGLHNAVVTATDKSGNLQTLTFNFTVSPFVQIRFNDTVNDIIITNYTARIFHPDGRITTPAVSANGTINLSPVNNNTLDLGNHTIEFSGIGFIKTNFTTTINASSGGKTVTFNVTESNIIINIVSKTNLSLITGINFSLAFIGPTGFTTSTTTGTTTVTAILNAGDYRMITAANGYETETVFFTYTNQESLPVTVYIEEVNNTGFVVIEVLDVNGQPIAGALTQARQWNSNTSSFIEISEQKTADNGKANLNIILNTKLYTFRVSKDSFITNSEEQTISTADNGKTITLTLDLDQESQSGFKFEDITYTAVESFDENTNTSTITFTWTNTLGTDVTACVNGYRLQGGSEVLIGTLNCTTDDSAQIIRDFVINGTQTYVLRAQFLHDGDLFTVEKFIRFTETSIFKQLEINNLHYFVLIFMHILGIFVGIALENTYIGSILMLLSTLVTIVMVPTFMTTSVAALMTFIGIITMLGGSKQ